MTALTAPVVRTAPAAAPARAGRAALRPPARVGRRRRRARRGALPDRRRPRAEAAAAQVARAGRRGRPRGARARRRRRCSTSAAGPGRHLAALAAAGHDGLGPGPLPRRGAARARPRRRGDPALRLRRRAARGHVGDRAAARRQHRHRRRARGAARPRPRARRAGRQRAGRDRTAGGADAPRPRAARDARARSARGSAGRRSARSGSSRSRAPPDSSRGHDRGGRALVRAAGAVADESRRRARSGPASGARRCAGRGSRRCSARSCWCSSSIVALTGFLSHAAYQPDLGRNALVGPDLPFTTFFDWPTGPSWLYALTQGLHVNVGLVAMPVLLAKLWSVIPRLFQWPPVRTPAEAIERASIAPARGEHRLPVRHRDREHAVLVRLPLRLRPGALLRRGRVRRRARRAPGREGAGRAARVPLARRAGAAAPGTRRDAARSPTATRSRPTPDPPTVSRRGLLAAVGAGSLVLLVANAGQSIGGPLRSIAFLAPRREGGFPVNKTAAGREDHRCARRRPTTGSCCAADRPS